MVYNPKGTNSNIGSFVEEVLLRTDITAKEIIIKDYDLDRIYL